MATGARKEFQHPLESANPERLALSRDGSGFAQERTRRSVIYDVVDHCYGFTATPYGLVPTGIVASTLLATVSITDRLLLP